MDNVFKQMVETRRKFHKLAEPGWLEFNTTIEIIEQLKKLGYKVDYGKKIHSKRMGLPSEEELEQYSKNLKEAEFDISEIVQGYTGAVATLDTGNPGKTIALRYDIDANDIQESNDETHRPTREGFKSQNDKAMHACAHDGHITIGLFLAKWVAENKDNLKGKYKFIFQPAEEGARGSASIVGANVLEDVDILLSGHIGLGVSSNVIGIGTKGFLGTTKFNIFYEGVASHAGAKPEEGRNALLGAAACTLGLHTLTQFSEGMSRVNVGRLVAGTGRNIVPSEAKLIIETRGETENIDNLLNEKVVKVATGAAKMYGLKVDIDQVGRAPAYNNVSENNILKGFIKYAKNRRDKKYKVIENPNLGASEDIARMMNFVEKNGGETVHMLYGSDLAAGHHNEKFDFDEKTLLNAYDIMIELLKFINKIN